MPVFPVLGGGGDWSGMVRILATESHKKIWLRFYFIRIKIQKLDLSFTLSCLLLISTGQHLNHIVGILVTGMLGFVVHGLGFIDDGFGFVRWHIRIRVNKQALLFRRRSGQDTGVEVAHGGSKIGAEFREETTTSRNRVADLEQTLDPAVQAKKYRPTEIHLLVGGAARSTFRSRRRRTVLAGFSLVLVIVQKLLSFLVRKKIAAALLKLLGIYLAARITHYKLVLAKKNEFTMVTTGVNSI